MNLLLQYIKAATNLYGIIHKEKLREIYNSQNDVIVSIEEVETYLGEDLSLHHVYSHKHYFVHETVMEFNLIKKLLRQKGKLPYYVPDKEELLKYADMLYYEKPESYRKLQQHLTQHYFKKEPENAEMLIQNIRDECLEGLNEERFANLMANFEVMPKNQKQASKIINMVTELSNNTRRWEHNGHTPQELGEMGLAYKPSSSTLLERIKTFLRVNF